jgi:hypothetical protein
LSLFSFQFCFAYRKYVNDLPRSLGTLSPVPVPPLSARNPSPDFSRSESLAKVPQVFRSTKFFAGFFPPEQRASLSDPLPKLRLPSFAVAKVALFPLSPNIKTYQPKYLTNHKIVLPYYPRI